MDADNKTSIIDIKKMRFIKDDLNQKIIFHQRGKNEEIYYFANLIIIGIRSLKKMYCLKFCKKSQNLSLKIHS